MPLNFFNVPGIDVGSDLGSQLQQQRHSERANKRDRNRKVRTVGFKLHSLEVPMDPFVNQM
jgi:hypothetical protein